MVGNVIFSLGEEKLLMLERKNIRISRDWVGNRWIDLQGKPDICSFLSSNIASWPNIQPSAHYNVAGGSVSDFSTFLESKILLIPDVQKDATQLSGVNPDDLENTKGTTVEKPLNAIDEDKENNNSGNVRYDVTNKNDDNDKGNKEKLVAEQNFECAKLKLEAAGAIEVA